MKKLLMSMAIVAFLIACGGSDSSKGNGNNPISNNNAKNGANNENAPCENPVSDDGSEPESLPVC